MFKETLMNTEVKEWKFVSDRLMTVDLEEGNVLKTIIVAYGSNDNAVAT